MNNRGWDESLTFGLSRRRLAPDNRLAGRVLVLLSYRDSAARLIISCVPQAIFVGQKETIDENL
jgi:hypothetical protein